MDEGVRVEDRALANEIGPELTRQIEFGVDLQRLRDVDAAIGTLWRIVQFTIGGMPGPGVVPRLGAFLRAILQRLEHGDRERGLQLLEHRAERGTHDSGADQNDIGTVS